MVDTETSVNSDAFIMGLLKMSILNVARVGLGVSECRLLFQLTRCTKKACCQSHPVEMFIKTTMPRDKKNQNFELFFKQSHEEFGCLQL
jgi:hypothetical protein